MKRIYTGPSLVAKRLIAELNEIGIQPVERNDLNSASIAGFAGAVPDQTQLFIREDEYEQASAIITAFIDNNS